MKVTVLDDYQHAIEPTAALARLRKKAEVQVLTERILSEETLIQTLAASQALIPIRQRTKFTAALIAKLPGLEFISQTGNHAYHIDMDAATCAGIVVSLAPGGNSTTELTFALTLHVMRRVARSDHARCAAVNGRSCWAMC